MPNVKNCTLFFYYSSILEMQKRKHNWKYCKIKMRRIMKKTMKLASEKVNDEMETNLPLNFEEKPSLFYTTKIITTMKCK